MSGFLTDILEEQRANTTGAEVWRATVAKTVTDVSERVPVTIPAYDPTIEVPLKCRWQPRVHMVTVNDGGVDASSINVAQIVYPQKGDDCLIAFDENDEPWILLYWPFA